MGADADEALARRDEDRHMEDRAEVEIVQLQHVEEGQPPQVVHGLRMVIDGGCGGEAASSGRGAEAAIPCAECCRVKIASDRSLVEVNIVDAQGGLLEVRCHEVQKVECLPRDNFLLAVPKRLLDLELELLLALAAAHPSGARVGW